ncbi:MAG: hypothetical protein NT090_17460 [Acidobacteria bacterium]|nr:hypothetical protein [Acidobacteriota bacterium]
MVSRKPILVFDTSVINQLTAEKDFPALAAGLTTAYSIRLTGSNISELVATTKSDKREHLLDTCQRLLASGECIDPFNWIVEKHTKAFDQNPEQYDWKKVNVRNREIEQEIVRPTFADDELARQEKESATETKESFEVIFCSMRSGFDEIFSEGTERPTTFAELVKHLQKPGGAFWAGYGHTFYARNVKDEPDERKVRDFADRCPPFLMTVLAAVMAQYKRAIVETPKKKKRAGRVDLLMSIYLPYCRVFVTHDDDQELCLREMAAVANLDREILSYDDFRSRLLATSKA